MKKPEDILSKSIEALAKMDVPAGPPPELIDTTVAKINKTSGGSQEKIDKIKSFDKIRFAKRLIKYAAAAVLVLSSGYTIGRLTGPNRLDIEQLRSALEPSIRQNLLQEMSQYWQVGLTSSYAQLKEELQKQYRQDLTDFAIQTLAATNAVTNQRLENLIKAINAYQMEDRRSVAAALEQIELNRRQDNSQLAAGLETLALQTEDQLHQTRQDIVKLLSNSQVDSLIPNKVKNSTNK